MNIIAERTKKDYRKFELMIDNYDILGNLNTYLPKLMNYLWEQHKIISLILQKSPVDDVKNYLAPLFANNFYENILSSYYIDDNLMYILTLLLEEEIKNLKDINDSEIFLNNTNCGYLLEELRRKSDIQKFFKNIILNCVENLEVNQSSVKIDFDIKKLSNLFKKKKLKENNNEDFLNFSNDYQPSEYLNLEDDDIIRNKKRRKTEQEIFNQKYALSLDQKTFETHYNAKKDDKRICDYFSKKLNECNSDKNIFANIKLYDDIYASDYSKTLLIKYQNDMMLIINFLDLIIENFLNNFHLLPYSVKCICKIISILIQKKFPTISEYEKNAFIAKFFFGKLLVPILENPGVEAFISNFIISQNTLNNLKIISDVLNKFVSGKFYYSNNKESNFAPFNLYFIEKIDKLFNIFENITKARLPPFIEKLINEQLPSDYEFDYFKENSDEVIRQRSIFFNIDQVNSLLINMNNLKNEIFTNKKTLGLEKTVEKLIQPINLNIIKNILDNEKNPPKSPQKNKKIEDKNEFNKEPKAKLHYFLISSLVYNKKYIELFEIQQETSNFSIKELKSTPDEESKTKNNIIKVKNFFCSLLYNYNKLVKTEFDEGKTENTEKILIELKKFMKSSNFVVDETIPSEWYATSLLEYLKKIPEYLTKNDCEELYKEIENNVSDSIKKLDFEILSVIMGKLKYAKKFKNYFQESEILLKDIKLNEISKSIIENELIPVELSFSLDDEGENGDFLLNNSNFKIKEKDKVNIERIKYEKKLKKDIKLCLTIDEFTKKFPNLVIYQELQDIDILQIQKKFQFSEKINKYINTIKEAIKTNYKEKLNSIIEKINDYIMSKLYDKIYPIEPYLEDNKIFQQTIKLHWVKPENFGKIKGELVFGSFLTDILKYFALLVSEKSIVKKFSNLKEIFSSIIFLLQFNGIGKDSGVDDMMPILNYAFIKAQPQRMYSNAKYMELYIGDKIKKNEGSQLTQLLVSCNFIENLKYSDLFDVTEEEFIKKCNEAVIAKFEISE